MPSWGPYLVNELISISIGGNSNKRRRRIAFPSRIILSLVVMHCQSVHTHSTGIELEVVLVYSITKKKSILRYSHANKMNITVPLNSWRYTTDKKIPRKPNLNEITESGPQVHVICRYDYVTLIPLVLQLGLRIGPIQRMEAN